jgi:hypothetical protein
MPTSVFDGEGQLMPWIHDYNPHTPTHLNILN